MLGVFIGLMDVLSDVWFSAWTHMDDNKQR